MKWRKEGNADDERNEGQMTGYCLPLSPGNGATKKAKIVTFVAY